MSPFNTHHKRDRRRSTVVERAIDTPTEYGDSPREVGARDAKSVSDDSWQYLKKKLHDYDQELVDGFRDELDTILVFAGLFSAVTTAFLVESNKDLEPEKSQAVVDAITRLAQQLGNTNETPLSSDDSDGFSPSVIVRTVNILWFFALTMSLFVALFALLSKQWLRQYLRWNDLNARDAIRVRQLRFLGVNRWDLQSTITILLPCSLQAAVILFVAGLIVYLWKIDPTTMYFVLTLIGLICIYLAFTLLAPVFSTTCPYRSPLVMPIRRILLLVKLLGSLSLQLTRIPFNRNPNWSEQFKTRLTDGTREILARLSRKRWVDIDRVRSQSAKRRVALLNSAYEWMRLNIQDRETYNRLVHNLGPTNSLSYVLDGGKRREWIQPRSLQDVLIWFTLDDEIILDPETVIRDIRSLFLSARPPQEPKNVERLLPAATAGLAELMHTRADTLSKQQLRRLGDLYWDMFQSQALSAIPMDYERLQEGLDAIYDFIATTPLDQQVFEDARQLCIQIAMLNRPSMDALLNIGCKLTLRPSTDSISRRRSTKLSATDFQIFSIFRISLLLMKGHLDDEHLCQLFETFCQGVMTFTSSLSTHSETMYPRDIPIGPVPDPAKGVVTKSYATIFNVADPKVVSKILPLVDHLVSKGIAEDPRLIAKGVVAEPSLSPSEKNLRDSGTTFASTASGTGGEMTRPTHLVVEVKDPLGEQEKEKEEQGLLPFFGAASDISMSFDT